MWNVIWGEDHFSKIAGVMTATFLKLTFLIQILIHFFCLNFDGLFKAAYAGKSLILTSILTFLITIGYTKSILSNFLGGKITDMVNTISVNHFQLKFLNLRRPLSFNLCWEALFNWSSEINIWVWRWKATKVFLLQGISQLLLFHSFLWHWFILECEFWLTSVCFEAHITNP